MNYFEAEFRLNILYEKDVIIRDGIIGCDNPDNDIDRLNATINRASGLLYTYINGLADPTTFDPAKLSLQISLAVGPLDPNTPGKLKAPCVMEVVNYTQGTLVVNAKPVGPQLSDDVLTNRIKNMISNLVVYANNGNPIATKSTNYSDKEIDDLFKDLFGE